MHRNSSCQRTSGLTALILGLAAPLIYDSTAHAGGLYIQEFVDSHQGSANAGAQALGTDPSAVFHNPAALSQLRGRQLSIGAGALGGKVKFDPSSSTPVPGGNGGNQASIAPLVGSYYSQEVNDRITFGVGLFSMSGAALDPNSSWTGRFQVQEIELLTVTGMLAASYEINEQWSIGAGIGLVYGTLDFDLAVPSPLGGEGGVNLDGDDIDFVGSFGIHYKPNDRLSLGIVGFSGFEMKFDGDLEARNAPPAISTETKLDFAPSIRAGLAYKSSDKLTLMASVAWENWSTLDNLYVSTSRGTAAVPRNWDDTYHASIGFRYQARDDLMFQAGLAYDSNPVDSVDRTADTPIDRQIRLAAGFEYQVRDNMKIRGAITYIDLGRGKIRSSNLVGDYKDNDLLAISLGVKYDL